MINALFFATAVKEKFFLVFLHGLDVTLRRARVYFAALNCKIHVLT